MSENGASNGRPELPEGWEWRTVGDVATVIRGVTFKKAESKDSPASGHKPVLRSGNVQRTLVLDQDLVWVPKKRIKDNQSLREGDIVVSVSNSFELLGKAARAEADWDGSIGAFLSIIRPKPGISSSYLGLFAQSHLWRSAVRSVAAATNNIANINMTKLKAVPVPVPSLTAQTEIAEAASTELARLLRIEDELRSIDLLEAQFRRAVLRDAFTGCLFTSKDDQVQTGNAGDAWFPEGWMVRKLGDVCEAVQKLKPTEDPKKEFKYIDISAIDRALLEVTAPKTLQGADAPSRARQLVKAGDVLFSTVRPNLRTIAPVPDDLDGSVASTGFCVLRSNDEIRSEFLLWAVLTDRFQAAIVAKARGVSYPAVRDKDVLNIEIAFPSLHEQDQTVAAIQAEFRRAAEVTASASSARRDLSALREAVLHQAFSGEMSSQPISASVPIG